MKKAPFTTRPPVGVFPPDPEADLARADLCAKTILRLLTEAHKDTRRQFTWTSARRALAPLGFGELDTIHAITQLVHASLVEPAVVAGQLGWRRTFASVPGADLAALRAAQRRYLGLRGWTRAPSRATGSNRVPVPGSRRALRMAIFTSEERWSHPDACHFPLTIDEAATHQAMLDEIPIQPTTKSARRSRVEAVEGISKDAERRRPKG